MNNLSWEDPPYHNSKEYEELCQNSKPSDFYFAVHESCDSSMGYTYVSIVPKLYFHKYGYMWDQSMFLDHLLPQDLIEAMECIWDAETLSVEDLRKDLLARGFEENEKFSTMASEDLD